MFSCVQLSQFFQTLSGYPRCASIATIKSYPQAIAILMPDSIFNQYERFCGISQMCCRKFSSQNQSVIRPWHFGILARLTQRFMCKFFQTVSHRIATICSAGQRHPERICCIPCQERVTLRRCVPIFRSVVTSTTSLINGGRSFFLFSGSCFHDSVWWLREHFHICAFLPRRVCDTFTFAIFWFRGVWSLLVRTRQSQCLFIFRVRGNFHKYFDCGDVVFRIRC